MEQSYIDPLLFAVAATLTVHAVRRTRELLERREELRALRERKDRSLTLVALAARATDAARQLSEPLGTIAAAARQLERPAPPSEIVGDARLIREQIERCRTILNEMRSTRLAPTTK